MTKTIDLGERYDTPAITTAKAKPQKYYPTIQVPAKIDPNMAGKRLTFVATGVVTAVRENSQVGRKAKSNADIEVHSITIAVKPKTSGGQYVPGYMDEMRK